MTVQFASIIRFIFTEVWHLFNGFYIPGTNVTPAGFLFMALFIVLVIRFVKRIFHVNSKGEE